MYDMIRPLVSVIIVNWNGKVDTLVCLACLSRQTYRNLEIIVIDNASSDGSAEEIKRRFKLVKLWKNKINEGFAEANNIGYKHSSGKYLLLLNNDTEIKDKEFIQKIVSGIEKDEKIGVLQPKIILSGSGKLQAGGAFLTFTGFLYHFGFGQNPNDPLFNRKMFIYSANGSCMLIRRELIEKIGLFDPDFFVYFEETDFCHRVSLAGYKILYFPETSIFHKGSKSTLRQKPEFTQFHAFKNRICSYLKNLGIKNIIIILPIHILLCELYTLLLIIKGNLKLALSTQKAIWWNVVNLPFTLKKRGWIQYNLRIVKNDNFLRLLIYSPKLSYYIYLLIGLKKYKHE